MKQNFHHSFTSLLMINAELLKKGTYYSLYVIMF